MTFDREDHANREAIGRIAYLYAVPATLGARVTVGLSPRPRTGTIVGTDQMSLILRDDEGAEFKAHPTWRTTYEPAADMRPAMDGGMEELQSLTGTLRGGA